MRSQPDSFPGAPPRVIASAGGRGRRRAAGLTVALGLALLAAPAALAQGPRDANCDGMVSEADRDAVARQLFAEAAPACAGSDINRDEALSAADLIAYAHGPRITFTGIASPDGQPGASLGRLEDGTPVYHRNSGFGFLLVVEATGPPSGAQVGTTTFNSGPSDPLRRPDFQVVVDRQLGDGSRAVCDEFGVPATDGAEFGLTQSVADTINDLACRFEVATRRNAACTQDSFGQLNFLNPDSRAQFCVLVTASMAFPTGDTRLRVQVRDQSGLLGPLGQMVLRVAPGPPPPTFTPPPATPTRTATETPSVTATASLTPTPSLTRTASPTATASHTLTRTRTATATPTPPATATRTRTATAAATAAGTPTRTPSGAATGTPTRSATRTPSGATPTRTNTGGATATRTPTAPTPTRTRTPTAGATATRTRTSAPTPTPPPTSSATRTRTPSPTPTPTGQARGPEITFFGLTRADDMLLQPVGMSGDIPIYSPTFGFGFSLVVEARPGTSRVRVGLSTLNDSAAPDLQIQVTRPLGDGSETVCDDAPPMLGGVPATNPPDFSDSAPINDRMNDLACRFIDGSGNKLGRACSESTACILGVDGQFGCVSSETTAQFCGFIGQVTAFPPGDTLVTVRLRDAGGNFGAPRQLILRVN